jgi:hypothetical protein
MNSSNASSATQEYRYAVLMETNGKEYESWYYFIRYEGNERNLSHLKDQLEQVEFFILDDLSTFDLDLEHLVCETTAREMCRLELNSFMFNRRFDGDLKRIDFGFKSSDKNKRRIVKVFEILGIGKIDEFIDNEYVDPDASKEEDRSQEEDGGRDAESSGTEYFYDDSTTEEDGEFEDESRSNKSESRERSESNESHSPSPKQKINRDRKLRDKILKNIK